MPRDPDEVVDVCGIAGVIGENLNGMSGLDRMLDAQEHRGPDGRGTWRDDVCSLGHLRLAVIDPSVRGCQPMTEVGGNLQVVYNGEMYNFAALRRELQDLGHAFVSGTDTEVVLKAYREWGPQCVHRFRGMFAFALWDPDRRRLFMARDRLGKKPLYYAHVGDTVVFASELQGLLTHPDVDRRVDLTAVDSYLTWGYIPAPATGFEGIVKLPPAHWMTVTADDGRLSLHVERWWSLQERGTSDLAFGDAVEQLREKLDEAVRLRLVSDVPLGAFLSGGVDSSIVVGLMARASSRPVKTFSIGFDEASHDELQHAARVARLWGTDHHEAVVRPDAVAVLPALVRHYGEPFADSSALPTYYVAQMARSHVTVALNGDGGDESFAGYDRYRGLEYAERIARLPGGSTASAALRRLVPRGTDPKSARQRADRFLAGANQAMSDRYGGWMTYFTEEDKVGLYVGGMREVLHGRRPQAWLDQLFADAGDLRPAEAAMSVDVQSYLPYDLLVKVDIATMAHSLEARSPLLDHEVMEFAATLPTSMKLCRGDAKHILKQAFAEMLPAQNVNRRKMGFSVPVGEWFRGPLRELVQDTLLAADSRTGQYLDRLEVRRLVSEHAMRRADHASKIWALLVLELWHREFVERLIPPG